MQAALRGVAGLVFLLSAAAQAAPGTPGCRATIGDVGLRATLRAVQRAERCRRQAGAAGCDASQVGAVALDLAPIEARCAADNVVRAAYPGADLRGALARVIDAEVLASSRALQMGAPADDAPRRRCQRAIGIARLRVVRAALRDALQCQLGLDAAGAVPGPLATTCLPRAGVATARAARAVAAACGAIDGARIGSCDDLPGCVVSASLATARGIAATLFGAAPGVAVRFDLDADLTSPTHFFDFPYPSDLRLRADGTPDLNGFPIPAGNALMANLRSVADRRPAFPAIPVAYLRFDGGLATRQVGDVIPAAIDAPVLLVDVDPESPGRGLLYPLVAATPPADAYLPANVLAVSPYPGIVLPAGRRYAFVVRRALAAADGVPLGVPLPVLELRAGGAPPGVRGVQAQALHAAVWETLARLGVPLDDVAAVSVFSVGDVVAALADLATALAARHALQIEDLAFDAAYPEYCTLRGSIRYPQFQRGIPPYNAQGDFVAGADGLPVVQRDEAAPVVIAIPRAPMPAQGYPLVQFFHGSGGVAAQVVDRGRVGVPDGTPEPGAGPAAIFAAHGIASVGSAHPLNPERLPGAASHAYLNLANLAAYPYTFRQGTIEQRLLLDALARLTIDPSLLAGCTGATMPPGASGFRLATDGMIAMGQSMGGQYTNYFAAIEPRVRAAIPTGSGGFFSLLVLVASLDPSVDTRALIGPVLIGTSVPLTPLHPGLALLESGWEWAEPLVFAPRLAVNPLPGHPARSIYEPIGVADPEFPDPIYAAMAAASGTRQAGPVLEPVVQQALAVAGRGGVIDYPVTANQVSDGGEAYTGAVVQFAGDDILTPHHIAFQLDAVKYQYGCFAASFFADGAGRVPAPAELGSPCP